MKQRVFRTVWGVSVVLLEQIILDAVSGGVSGKLAEALNAIVRRIKSDRDWKKLFVDAGVCLADLQPDGELAQRSVNSESTQRNFIHETAATVAEEVLPQESEQEWSKLTKEIFSKKNMEALAAQLKGVSGYELKEKLLQGLMGLMEGYNISHSRKRLYANAFYQVVLHEIMQQDPEKYDACFLADWREEQARENAELLEQIFRLNRSVEEYHRLGLGIYTADEVDERLRSQSRHRRIGIDFFRVDDDDFQKQFDSRRADPEVTVIGRSLEETRYCVINELWRIGETRPILVVGNEKGWEYLYRNPTSGNIYIPSFYAETIVALEGNTNIFLWTEDCPRQEQSKTIRLRPRTVATVTEQLHKAGMEYGDAERLVLETKGLYGPLKWRVFYHSGSKEPSWKQLPENVRKTCLLLGQWTDADGDQEIVSELSGLTFDDFTAQIREYSTGEDPLIYICVDHQQEVYCLTDPDKTWSYKWNRIAARDPLWKRFISLLKDVLNEAEALFTCSEMEKLHAQLKGEKLFWSEELRTGMVRTLIMMEQFGSEGSQRLVDGVVGDLLAFVDSEAKWQYIARFFVDLCEASPAVVLDRVEREFDAPTGFLALFEHQASAKLMESKEYLYLLRGLEILLTQRAYALRAWICLVKIDDLSCQYSDSNFTTVLEAVLCPWHSSTAFQSPAEKCHAAEAAMLWDQNAWDRIYSALKMQAVFKSNNTPRYREHCEESMATPGELQETKRGYLKILRNNTKGMTKRWAKLLDLDCDGEIRQEILEQLVSEAERMTDTDKVYIKNVIRKKIYKNRFFSSSDWALGENELAIFVDALPRIRTEIPEYEYVWLFTEARTLPEPAPFKKENYQKENEKRAADLMRRELNSFRENGYRLSVLLELCADCSSGIALGRALALYWDEGEFHPETFKLILEHEKSSGMSLDYLRAINEWGDVIFSDCLEMARKIGRDEKYLAELYRVEAQRTKELPLIYDAPEEIRKCFWRSNGYFLPKEHIDLALRECRQYGELSRYLELLYALNREHDFGPERIYEALWDVESMRCTRTLGVECDYMRMLLAPLQKLYCGDPQKRLRIARLEMIFLREDWKDMPCFRAALSTSPELYAEMVTVIYREEGAESRALSEEESRYVERIYELYEKAHFCPAERDGRVDPEELDEWLCQFRSLLRMSNREYLYGQLVGRLLAYAPPERDAGVKENSGYMELRLKDTSQGFDAGKGLGSCETAITSADIDSSIAGWNDSSKADRASLRHIPAELAPHIPCRAVLDVMERDSDERMRRAYATAIRNERGAFVCDVGRSESRLAQRYREIAEYLNWSYPKTAQIYYDLERQYQEDARKERKRAERE